MRGQKSIETHEIEKDEVTEDDYIDTSLLYVINIKQILKKNNIYTFIQDNITLKDIKIRYRVTYDDHTKVMYKGYAFFKGCQLY